MLGGRPGSRLSARQKKPTSRMTLLRLVRALPEPGIETPQVIGVDEFAFRRGRRYGTIVIDGDDHHVIDLLEDPSAEALVGWLTEHPGAEVICRDRDGVYAGEACTNAAVADRCASSTTSWTLRVNGGRGSTAQTARGRRAVDVDSSEPQRPPNAEPNRFEMNVVTLGSTRSVSGLTIAATPTSPPQSYNSS